MNIAVFPHKRNFTEIETLLERIQTEQDEAGQIILIGDDRESVRIAARMFGFTFVDTVYDENRDTIRITGEYPYSKKRAVYRCFAQSGLEAKEAVLNSNKIDVVIGDRQDESLAINRNFVLFDNFSFDLKSQM